MWIVKLALRQPYTFIVMALSILILGVVAIYRTPVDIFPVVDIPVVSVIWTYSGMAPEEMTGRITTVQAAVNVAKATIAANEANVQQLMALQGFKRIYAPFAGIISARNVEVGSLINAGSASNVSTSTGAPPSGATIPGSGAAQISPGNPSAGGGLFQIARIDTLRIYINVPQTFSSSIKPGRKVEINVREFPQEKFTGLVARTTSALDPASRTLLTEVRIPNPMNNGYQLLPGMYATVKIGVTLAQPPIRIPATALVIRADGSQVVTVTKDQKAHFQKVVIVRDYGNELDIVSSLEPGATLVVNAPDDLQEGSPVRAQPAQTAPLAGEAKGLR